MLNAQLYDFSTEKKDFSVNKKSHKVPKVSETASNNACLSKPHILYGNNHFDIIINGPSP